MADISRLTVSGVTYDIKDKAAREGLPLIGSGEPGPLTQGQIGQIYVDSVSLRAFACVQEIPSVDWKEISNVIVLGDDERSACLPGCSAQAEGSVALGTGTVADGPDQLAIGRHNYGLSSNYLAVVGNGASSSSPSNAAALDTDGTLRIKGNAYVGCFADSSGGDRVATESWVGNQGFLTDIPDASVTNDKLNITKLFVHGSATDSTAISSAGSGSFGHTNFISGAGSVVIGNNNDAIDPETQTRTQGVTGNNSLLVGQQSLLTGVNSASFGSVNKVTGSHAFTQGKSNTVSGYAASAFGEGLTATVRDQNVRGKNNSTTSGYADVVGWGSDSSNKKNISALTTNGDLKLKGDVYVNCADNSTGGVLLNRIDYGASDPTTGTAGSIGQLYVNTTTGNVFSCVSAGSPYAWINLSSGGGIPVLTGATDPTSSTVGIVGQIYVNTTSLLIYVCVDSAYTWTLVSNREVLIEIGTTPYATIKGYLDRGCVVYGYRTDYPQTGDLSTYICTGHHVANDNVNYCDFSYVYSSGGWRFVSCDCSENDAWTYTDDGVLLPHPPVANGTYTLRCTVSGGVPTISWA